MKRRPVVQRAVALAFIVLASDLGPLHGEGERAPARDSAETATRRDPSVGGSLDADRTRTGVIVGRATYDGAPPRLQAHSVGKGHRASDSCGESIPNDTLVVGDKGEIANVVVSLVDTKRLPRAAPKQMPLVIERCRFVPHVGATTVRSRLEIGSKDDILHTVLGRGGTEFHVAVQPEAELVKRVSAKPGCTVVVSPGCPWMSAFVWAFEHDFFAVTSAKGSFRIEGVPPGTYTIRAWHETLAGLSDAPLVKKVTVMAGETSTIEFEMKPRAKIEKREE